MLQNNLEDHFTVQLNAFDEIISEEDVRPFSGIDVAGIKGALSTWRGDGIRVAATAMMWEFIPHSEQQKTEYLSTALMTGWVPFYVADVDKEYRIIKTAKGRKLLGGERVLYRLYQLQPSGRFTFVSEHKSINMAAWALFKAFSH